MLLRPSEIHTCYAAPSSESSLANTLYSQPLYLVKVDDGVRPCSSLLVKMPVGSDACHRGRKLVATRGGRSGAGQTPIGWNGEVGGGRGWCKKAELATALIQEKRAGETATKTLNVVRLFTSIF